MEYLAELYVVAKEWTEDFDLSPLNSAISANS